MLKVSSLMRKGHFEEAAERALSIGEQKENEGNRETAFDCFGTACKSYKLGNENEACLRAFEHAVQLLETDLSFLPQAGFVVGRLAEWPELFSWASLAALELGDAERAIDIAEIGRSRLLARHIGPSAQNRPKGVSTELWSRYGRAWLRAMALAVSRSVGKSHVEGEEEKRLETELTTLRKELVTKGVDLKTLSPVTTPLKCSEAIELLAGNPRRTAVLYAIRLEEGALQFIHLTAEGAQAIPAKEDAQKQIMGALEQYTRALREMPERSQVKIDKELKRLFEATRDVVGDVLSQTVRPGEFKRLLWIPHGDLVNLPLSAYPCSGGNLIDHVAILVAPSLTFGRDALAGDQTIDKSCIALRGRNDEEEAPTIGGGILLSTLTGDAVEETEPRTMEELKRSIGSHRIVLLTCHGLYEWEEPLNTRLKLGAGFDLPVRSMFDCDLFPGDTLVVLGACDSGTVAQADINEAMGIPVGLMASGARTVIGAAWPVPHLAAIGICRMVLERIARGMPSPEALRAAVCWMRDASFAEFRASLAPTGHPIAEEIPELEETQMKAPIFSGDGSFTDWAPYMHWGGGVHL